MVERDRELMPPRERPPRRTPRSVVCRGASSRRRARGGARGGLVAVASIGGETAPAAADDRGRRRRSRSGSSSRRASRASRWPTASRPSPRSPSASAASDAEADARALPRRDAGAASPPGFGRNGRDARSRASSSRRPTTSPRDDDRRGSSCRDQLEAFRANWAKVDLRYARSKNLTPYDVLIIASMIEKEAVAPEERRLVAAVIYNRLHARMPLGIDATLRYGLHIPPTESITQSQLDERQRRTTRASRHGPAADADREPRARRRSRRRRTRRRSTTSTSSRKPDKQHHFFTASDAEFDALHGRARVRMIGGATRLVGLLGHPVAHSLSPRMQNAAFAARGLDWAYVPLPTSTPERLEEAVRGLVALGFAGANVTTRTSRRSPRSATRPRATR